MHKGAKAATQTIVLLQSSGAFDVSNSELLSIDILFAAPRFSRAQISPDGARIAYVAPWNGRLNIFVREIGSTSAQADGDRRKTADENRNIESFSWSPDSAWILFVQDSKGDENWHLHRVAVAGHDPAPVDLTPFAGVRVISFGFLPNQPKSIFLQMNARSPAFTDLHRLDLTTGELVTLAENPGRFVHWIPGVDDLVYALVICAQR